MARKTGYFLIVYFVLQLALMLAAFSSFPEWLKAVSTVSVAVFFPFAFALLFINASADLRKKVKTGYLIFSLVIATVGIISKVAGVLGANVELVVAVLWYCFAYAPLELKYKYLKWKPFSVNVFEILLLSVASFVGVNAIVLGILFKMMHWYGGNVMLGFGAFIGLISMLSWNYKFRNEVIKRKESEDKILEQYTLIQDSINYAKRIQAAKLPRQDELEAVLPEYFVLYKPKDIVSGDFYYVHKHAQEVIVAAADCTGHGVPGALMSMISYERLDDAVRNTTNTSEILSRVNKGIKASLRQTDSFDSTRDGMDIALCSINFETGELRFSGANRPLWIGRNNSIEQVKPTKVAIGGLTADEQHFETQCLKLEKGDTLYLFSDGYADSFSEDDRKLTTNGFRELLLQIQGLALKDQESYLDNFIKTWMGKMEQIDDILVMGIRY